jgi:rod shape-determining protein MreD
MSNMESAAALRLREAAARPSVRRGVDAEISVAPRFSTLALLGLAAVLLQATVLHGFALRGAHVSLVTVLVVWTGLRCGVVTGGWLGFFCGLLEDALGGHGSNVLGAALVGFLAGTLSNRFFSDSLPIFIASLVAATALRFAFQYAFFEIAYHEHGTFHLLSHEFIWAALLNAVTGAIVLLGLRARAHLHLRHR